MLEPTFYCIQGEDANHYTTDCGGNTLDKYIKTKFSLKPFYRFQRFSKKTWKYYLEPDGLFIKYVHEASRL